LALAFQTPSDALLNAALRTLWIIDHPLLVRDVLLQKSDFIFDTSTLFRVIGSP
jgi:hypothetical protein